MNWQQILDPGHTYGGHRSQKGIMWQKMSVLASESTKTRQRVRSWSWAQGSRRTNYSSEGGTTIMLRQDTLLGSDLVRQEPKVPGIVIAYKPDANV